MKIDRYEIHLPQLTEPVIAGLNIAKRYGLTHINMFALAENKKVALSDHLWTLTRHVLNDVFDGGSPDDVEWTLTSGRETTRIKFTTENGSPRRIDISNKRAFHSERHSLRSDWPEDNWPIQRYESEYDGPLPERLKQSRVRMRIRDPEPETAFAIPTNHPAAKDGVFYCQPSYWGSSIQDEYEYIMVDTAKLLRKIEQDDPHMMQHAAYKYRGESAESWLEANTFAQGPEMGHFVYNEFINPQGNRGRGADAHSKLTMSAGNAGTLLLARDLGLAYYPIAISKAEGAARIQALRNEIGYGVNSSAGFNPTPYNR